MQNYRENNLISLEEIKKLIESGADINTNKENDLKILHQAVILESLEVCKNLIETGAEVNVTDKQGYSPLHHAVNYKYTDICKFLLSVGADVELQSENGSTPLHIAAMDGNIDIISDLLVAGADIDAKRKNGETAINIAIKESNLDIFKLLIDVGADIEARNQFGITPLMRAAKANKECFLKMLLEKGADVNARDMHGSSALLFASERSIANVRVLLKAGADINVRDENGMTCLMRAARANKEDILIEILKTGANIHDTNKNGVSAFSYACLRNNISIVKTLIDLGSNVDGLKNYLTINCPEYFIRRELMHVLNEAGADTNIRFGKRYLVPPPFVFSTFSIRAIRDEAWNRLMKDMTETLMEIADIHLDILLENFREIPISIHPHSLLRIMVKNYVLLKLRLNKPNSIASINELSEWWDDCSDQVNKMQNHVLGKSSVNLRKYLNERDPNIRAHLLFKAGIITQDRIGVEISWCHKNFPIYAESIHYRFNQDLKRGRILYSWNFIAIKNKFGKLNSLIRSKIGEQLTTSMALEHVKPSG